jgi:cysteine-rich repeat protein
LSTCTKCKSPYYLSSGFCYPCSSSCLSCSGPGHVQCLSCVYPLFLNSTICVNITCQSYQYVDSLAGCKDCSSLFSNSQTCNTTDVLTCANGYKKTSQTVCTMCSAITGYYIDSSHQCSEICGDGLLFELACDDGNNEDGDGCSSRCSIEEGWTCTHSSPSVCTLTGGLMANVYKQDKVAGKNQLYLYVSLSIALKLANKNFQFSYNSISGNPI